MDTPLSECMGANVPNITLFKNRWEIDQSFQSLFKEMFNNKLIFFDPLSAAKQVNFIYDYVSEWWNEKKIQNTIQNFNELLIFGKNYSSLKNPWLRFLREKI